MTLFDLQFKLWYMLNFLPFFLLVKWLVFAICLQHLLFALLKHGWHLPNFFSFRIIGLLLCNLCLHSSCFKFLFLRNAMTGLSVNNGAIFCSGLKGRRPFWLLNPPSRGGGGGGGVPSLFLLVNSLSGIMVRYLS